MGLSFDAWAFFHQLPAITAMARRHPGLNIVSEHCGGLLGYGPYAGQSHEVFETWRRNLAQLADCPNVSLKIGGTLGRLAAYDYLNVERPEPSHRLAQCLKPYVLTGIELFGPERCMFESNYPVDAVVTGYRVLWNTFKRLTTCLRRSWSCSSVCLRAFSFSITFGLRNIRKAHTSLGRIYSVRMACRAMTMSAQARAGTAHRFLPVG